MGILDNLFGKKDKKKQSITENQTSDEVIDMTFGEADFDFNVPKNEEGIKQLKQAQTILENESIAREKEMFLAIDSEVEQTKKETIDKIRKTNEGLTHLERKIAEIDNSPASRRISQVVGKEAGEVWQIIAAKEKKEISKIEPDVSDKKYSDKPATNSPMSSRVGIVETNEQANQPSPKVGSDEYWQDFLQKHSVDLMAHGISEEEIQEFYQTNLKEINDKRMRGVSNRDIHRDISLNCQNMIRNFERSNQSTEMSKEFEIQHKSR